MTDRDAFEAWWDSDFRPSDDKLYEAAWNVWQAALAYRDEQRAQEEPVASMVGADPQCAAVYNAGEYENALDAAHRWKERAPSLLILRDKEPR